MDKKKMILKNMYCLKIKFISYGGSKLMSEWCFYNVIWIFYWWSSKLVDLL